MRRGTDRHTDTDSWLIYISPRLQLRLTRNLNSEYARSLWLAYLLLRGAHVDTANATYTPYGPLLWETWRHPQNRKYITYSIAIRGRPSNGPGNRYRKFREVWTCGFLRYASAQTDRQTDTFIAVLPTNIGGEVIILCQLSSLTDDIHVTFGYVRFAWTI